MPPPSSDPSTKEYVDPTTTVDPLPSSSSDESIRSMLTTVMIVQAAHGQILVDVLMSFRLYGLIWRVLDIPLLLQLLMMSHDFPLVICHKKRGVHINDAC